MHTHLCWEGWAEKDRHYGNPLSQSDWLEGEPGGKPEEQSQHKRGKSESTVFKLPWTFAECKLLLGMSLPVDSFYALKQKEHHTTQGYVPASWIQRSGHRWYFIMSRHFPGLRSLVIIRTTDEQGPKTIRFWNFWEIYLGTTWNVRDVLFLCVYS